MTEGKHCSYMNKVCSGNCEWAYEHRHGSAGYTCMRPETSVEKRLASIEFALFKVEEATRELKQQLQYLKETK